MKRHARDYTPEGSIDLLKGILAGSPKLPDAQCRNRSHLFDPQGHGEPSTAAASRHAAAVALCHRCPALGACATWVETLHPRERPAGVVAGQAPRLLGRPAAA